MPPGRGPGENPRPHGGAGENRGNPFFSRPPTTQEEALGAKTKKGKNPPVFFFYFPPLVSPRVVVHPKKRFKKFILNLKEKFKKFSKKPQQLKCAKKKTKKVWGVFLYFQNLKC